MLGSWVQLRWNCTVPPRGFTATTSSGDEHKGPAKRENAHEEELGDGTDQ